MTSLFASLDKFDEISRLINQRLLYMRAVAFIKARKNLAIEDAGQEKKTLHDMLHLANTFGFENESIRSFALAQITTAKIIQHRCQTAWCITPTMAAPLFESHFVRHADVSALEDLRLQIAMLSEGLLIKLHSLLSDGGLIESCFYSRFILATRTSPVSAQEKKRLFSALVGIKSKTS